MLSQHVTVNAGRDRVGDHPPAIPTNTNVSVDSAAAGGRGPRGGGGSAPTAGDLPTAETACTGAVLVPASALPGRIPAPGRGLQPGGVRPVIGGAAGLAEGVCRRGG